MLFSDLTKAISHAMTELVHGNQQVWELSSIPEPDKGYMVVDEIRGKTMPDFGHTCVAMLFSSDKAPSKSLHFQILGRANRRPTYGFAPGTHNVQLSHMEEENGKTILQFKLMDSPTLKIPGVFNLNDLVIINGGNGAFGRVVSIESHGIHQKDGASIVRIATEDLQVIAMDSRVLLHAVEVIDDDKNSALAPGDRVEYRGGNLRKHGARGYVVRALEDRGAFAIEWDEGLNKPTSFWLKRENLNKVVVRPLLLSKVNDKPSPKTPKFCVGNRVRYSGFDINRRNMVGTIVRIRSADPNKIRYDISWDKRQDPSNDWAKLNIPEEDLTRTKANARLIRVGDRVVCSHVDLIDKPLMGHKGTVTDIRSSGKVEVRFDRFQTENTIATTSIERNFLIVLDPWEDL